jgi:hypothetical protein
MNPFIKQVLIEATCLAVIIGICILIGYVFVEHSLPAMGFK